MWKRRSFVIPFFASASFSMLLGSWRVRVFKVESTVAGKGEVRAGMKILRSCENIHSWISLSGDLIFSHQQGIYGFKFPKRFLEISSRDLTLLSIPII